LPFPAAEGGTHWKEARPVYWTSKSGNLISYLRNPTCYFAAPGSDQRRARHLDPRIVIEETLQTQMLIYSGLDQLTLVISRQKGEGSTTLRHYTQHLTNLKLLPTPLLGSVYSLDLYLCHRIIGGMSRYSLHSATAMNYVLTDRGKDLLEASAKSGGHSTKRSITSRSGEAFQRPCKVRSTASKICRCVIGVSSHYLPYDEVCRSGQLGCGAAVKFCRPSRYRSDRDLKSLVGSAFTRQKLGSDASRRHTKNNLAF
jgi:hypothetical protein